MQRILALSYCSSFPSIIGLAGTWSYVAQIIFISHEPTDFRVEKLFQVARYSPHIELFQSLSRKFSTDLWSFAE